MRKSDGRITASDLYDHLLLALGRLTEFRAGASVSHEIVVQETLKLAGISLDNPEILEGRNGLNRRVHFAWRNQCQKYCARSRRVYCQAGSSRGYWALTSLGVEKARTLDEPSSVNPVEDVTSRLDKASLKLTVDLVMEADTKPSKPQQQVPSVPQKVVKVPVARPSNPNRNLTAQWVETKGPELIERLRTHLERKMPRSMIMGKIEDHIQGYLTNLIRRDGLRTRIEQGVSIPLSQVCNWCRRSAYSDIRDEGRDPVTRTLHGALTKDEWERNAEVEWTREVIPTTINQSDQLSLGSSFGMGTYDPDDAGVSAMDYLVSSNDVEQEFANTEAFDVTMDAINEAILSHLEGKSHDKDLHLAILHDRYVKQLSMKELAAKHNIQKEKANQVVSRIRKAVRKANDNGRFDFLAD